MYLVFCPVSNVFFLLDLVAVVTRFRVDLGSCRKFCFVTRLFPCVLQAVSLTTVLRLAYQSLGVVYGDLGTSPLYVFKSTFANVGVSNKSDIIGALSLIIYTLTIIPLIKYVLIVLRANDNGEGSCFHSCISNADLISCADSSAYSTCLHYRYSL